MPITRVLALFRGEPKRPPTTAFEDMRDALRPEKIRPAPPTPPAKPKIQKR